MTHITIDTCQLTPNVDALEAIQKWMLMNYLKREYQQTRTLKVKSGREITVTEIDIADKNSSCDASFTCEAIDNMRVDDEQPRR